MQTTGHTTTAQHADGWAPARARSARLPRVSHATVALGAFALVGLHVADDSFLQPEPGTSALDHLSGGLVPLGLLGLAAVAYRRGRAGLRAAIVLVAGLLALVVGASSAGYETVTVGPSGDDFTGLLVLPAGLALVGLGVWTLWRSRKLGDRLRRRYARRTLIAIAAAVVTNFLLFPVAFAYVITHVMRQTVPEANLEAAYEDVSFTTSDGLELQGWYVPSKNGAAVIAFPGRSGPRAHTRMLASHGYGVLLFDRRGEGSSEGDSNLLGWGGHEDILGAIEYLKTRPDVDPGRIGGIGLSVGGELMLQVAAQTDALAAVVSDGAGTRTLSEDVDEFDGIAKLVSLPFLVTKTAAVGVFSDTAPPPKLMDLMARVDSPLLIIHNGRPGEQISGEYFAAAGSPKSEWVVPEAPHTGAASTRPHEYERRLIGFLDRTLPDRDGR